MVRVELALWKGPVVTICEHIARALLSTSKARWPACNECHVIPATFTNTAHARGLTSWPTSRELRIDDLS